MSQYFNETIYNDMQQNDHTFPTIEFQGHDRTTLKKNMSHVFNKDQLDEIDKAVGQSIYHRHLMTELAKGRQEHDTFEELTQCNVSNNSVFILF